MSVLSLPQCGSKLSNDPKRSERSATYLRTNSSIITPYLVFRLGSDDACEELEWGYLPPSPSSLSRIRNDDGVDLAGVFFECLFSCRYLNLFPRKIEVFCFCNNILPVVEIMVLSVNPRTSVTLIGAGTQGRRLAFQVRMMA